MTKKLIDGQIVSVKDESGAYVPSHMVPPPKTKRVRDPKPSDISLSELLDKHLLLLYRETRQLLRESANGGKLSKDSSTCVRENLRLIMDLKKKERELLDNLSEEELKKLIEDKSEQA